MSRRNFLNSRSSRLNKTSLYALNFLRFSFCNEPKKDKCICLSIVSSSNSVNFDFSAEYEKAIEAKQVSQQQALKAENDLKDVTAHALVTGDSYAIELAKDLRKELILLK